MDVLLLVHTYGVTTLVSEVICRNCVPVGVVGVLPAYGTEDLLGRAVVGLLRFPSSHFVNMFLCTSEDYHLITLSK